MSAFSCSFPKDSNVMQGPPGDVASSPAQKPTEECVEDVKGFCEGRAEGEWLWCLAVFVILPDGSSKQSSNWGKIFP